MASLDVDSETIVPQDIVDRYHDWVTNYANGDIAWGSNTYPFGEFAQSSVFGGETGGIATTVTGADLGIAGNNITANPIYSILLEHTRKYLRIRKIQAKLNVTGDGGNTGSRGSPGIIFDETKKAHLRPDFTTNLESRYPSGYVPQEGINAGQTVSAYWLEIFFSRLRERYEHARDEDIPVFQTDVCHASCHSSCHSSRGRR